MASVVWDAELAAVYDDVYAGEAEPSVVGPMVEVLDGLANGGAALEFAVGTGRIAWRSARAAFRSRESSYHPPWPNVCGPNRAPNVSG